MKIHFSADVLAVSADRVNAKIEGNGDFLISLALGDEGGDLNLAFGKRSCFRPFQRARYVVGRGAKRVRPASFGIG